VRWKHPKHGYISPARFIPVAEETGLIVPLGEFVLQRAIRLGDGDHLHAYFTRTRAIRRGIIEAGQDTAAPDFGRVAAAAPKGG
jgi:hypothetical protein